MADLQLAPTHGLEAHAKPPEHIRKVYKKFQKQSIAQTQQESVIIQSFTQDVPLLSPERSSKLPEEIRQVFLDFLGTSTFDQALLEGTANAYVVPGMPGLVIYPQIIPPAVQLELLDRLLLRDLNNPKHETNVHLHYSVPYPRTSYFGQDANDLIFQPKDPAVHKPITTQQYLDKKLRWMTLGGQYDWTNKVYPPTSPPPFPSDIKTLIEQLFPLKAEAAIVNLYQPGDTLSLHRDVSEPTPHVRPLVSISIGCDAIFVVGNGTEGEDAAGEGATVTLRLRSGDALLMSGESRYAWHGVPKVIEDTCPEWMQAWPCTSDPKRNEVFEHWRGWAKRKRININIRQMFN